MSIDVEILRENCDKLEFSGEINDQRSRRAGACSRRESLFKSTFGGGSKPPPYK